jgi:hypothetical protein
MPVTPLPPIPPPPSVKGSGGSTTAATPPSPAPGGSSAPPALDPRVAGRVTPGAVLGTDPGPRLPAAEIPGPPGWPALPARDAPNFTDAKPVHITPGTKIYRVFDAGTNPAGSYWALALPASEESWRSGNAVLDSWNAGTLYVEYTVPPGDGLHVWQGGTSGQGLKDDGDPNHVLTGGEQQIWMPRNTIPKGDLTPQPTPWSGGGTGGST